MRYFNYIEDSDIFYKAPEYFNYNSEKEILSHALGATLYIPAIRDNLMKDIISTFPGTAVLCLEDSVASSLINKAEENLIRLFQLIEKEAERNKEFLDSLPLIFIRVRDISQMERILNKSSLKGLCGFVLPKFNAAEGEKYLELISNYNAINNRNLYVMPILETAEVIYRETRITELLNIKKIFDKYKKIILNIRIGGTDLSGIYSLRRSKEFTIYDVGVVRDCISDIVNVFKRDGYVISAPVNEYYDDNSTIIKEILLDKANGLIGKTAIHPKQVRVINSLMAVSMEEYIDAKTILESDTDGVVRSTYSNKMNEVRTHYRWAREIMILSKITGVLNHGKDFRELL